MHKVKQQLKLDRAYNTQIVRLTELRSILAEL